MIMEKITINPKKVEIFGNIISDEHGYIETTNDFQSYKCIIQPNAVKSKEYGEYNVYSFRMSSQDLHNSFMEAIQYCKEASLNSLFVCEHFNLDFSLSSEYFDVIPFTNGYSLRVKEKYISNGVDITAPFYLLIHQNNAGVEIPANASSVCFTSNYDAKNTISSILVGFVFFNENGELIENQEITDIANEGYGNEGRCNVSTTNIPESAKYVSVEFAFPEGVSAGDYFSLQLNCLLFNSNYAGFIKN